MSLALIIVHPYADFSDSCLSISFTRVGCLLANASRSPLSAYCLLLSVFPKATPFASGPNPITGMPIIRTTPASNPSDCA